MCGLRVKTLEADSFQKELIDDYGDIGECLVGMVCLGTVHGLGLGAWHRHHGVGPGNGLARAGIPPSLVIELRAELPPT